MALNRTAGEMLQFYLEGQDVPAIAGIYKNRKSLSEHSERDFRGDSRIRTGDPNIANVVLYQLSYIPGTKKAGLVVRLCRPWQS